MQYCTHCQVYVRGAKENCPLCGNILPKNDQTGEQGEQEDIFPIIPPVYKSNLAIRIMIFISFAAVVGSFAIRMIFPTNINWPVFVVFGIISMWLSLVFIVRKRHNMPKTIMWQVFIVSVLSVFWDWQTGWRGWSLDYLIPIIYVAAEIVMYVTAKITKLSARDYITYALIGGLFGIIPILFIIFDWVRNPYPSIVCVSISIIFLSAIFIFQGDNIKMELNKRMHI